MAARPLYPRGRLSVPVSGPRGERHVRLDHNLISRLREARGQGDDAMTAAEQYDPDFSVKLSACTEEADANRLLDEWLEHRLAILKRTQEHLRHLWQEAQDKQAALPSHPDTAADRT